jgi:hypothetical protein
MTTQPGNSVIEGEDIRYVPLSGAHRRSQWSLRRCAAGLSGGGKLKVGEVSARW